MTICRELKRQLNSKGFKLCFLIYLVFYLFLNYKSNKVFLITEKNFYKQLFFLSFNYTSIMNSFFFIVPLLAGIVGSDVFGEDIRNSLYKSTLLKEGKKRYIYNRAVVSFLMGGIFVISVYILDMLIKLTIYPVTPPTFHIMYTFRERDFFSDLWIYHTNLYVFFALVNTFCYSGLCSLLGFVVSLFINKRIIPKIAPFVITYLLWNIASIFNFSGYTIQNMLNFRYHQITDRPEDFVIRFFVPFIVCCIIVYFKDKRYEYI